MTDVDAVARLQDLQREYREIELRIVCAEREAIELGDMSTFPSFPFDRYRIAKETCSVLEENLNELIDKIDDLISKGFQ